tara:strand:- start:318 stop:497 length:180 start_codon:yes stop_codon:yes gene_type:complete
MLEFPSSINTEQLVQSLVLYQLLETLEAQEKIENFSELEKALTEQLLWEIINSLEPIEE